MILASVILNRFRFVLYILALLGLCALAIVAAAGIGALIVKIKNKKDRTDE